jgi:hypothetical protein
MSDNILAEDVDIGAPPEITAEGDIAAAVGFAAVAPESADVAGRPDHRGRQCPAERARAQATSGWSSSRFASTCGRAASAPAGALGRAYPPLGDVSALRLPSLDRLA